MERVKQEKGITLIMLTIIIIALFILVGVSMNTGLYDISSTLDSRLEGELRIVQYAVLQQYAKYKTTLDASYLIGTDFNSQIQNFRSTNYNSLSLAHNIQNNDEKYKHYFKITKEQLVSLGVQDSQYSYVVNYYTGEVFNADVFVTSIGTPLYVKGKN